MSVRNAFQTGVNLFQAVVSSDVTMEARGIVFPDIATHVRMKRKKYCACARVMVKAFAGTDLNLYLPLKAGEESDKLLYFTSEEEAVARLGEAGVGDKVLRIASYRSWLQDEDAEAILKQLPKSDGHDPV